MFCLYHDTKLRLFAILRNGIFLIFLKIGILLIFVKIVFYSKCPDKQRSNSAK
jgi:hypothetical protein